MKERLAKILGLRPEASEDQIIGAGETLKTQAAGAANVDGRESEVRDLMKTTGMHRADAEHVIDQRSREAKTRQSPGRTDFMQRQLSPHGF